MRTPSITATQASQTGPSPRETNSTGEFVLVPNAVRDRITADGSSGFKAEPSGSHLYISLACPWDHRAIIVRLTRTAQLGPIALLATHPGRGTHASRP